MKKILILYFSGVGNTKLTAEKIHYKLNQTHKADIFSVEDSSNFKLSDYDAFVFGTPVHHAAPAKKALSFFDHAGKLSSPSPAFIYNTKGLYACNTNRIFASKIKECNIITILDKEYRTPATDGSLLAPFIPLFFQFEKNFEKKISRDCEQFSSLLNSSDVKAYIPRFRISSILNAPNKLAGQRITFHIHLHKERCIKCGKCIRKCPYDALVKEKNSYPSFISRKCENCYRCIHHCPCKALSLSKKKILRKQLNYRS